MGNEQSKIEVSDKRFISIQGFIREIINQNDAKTIIPDVILKIIFNYMNG